MRQVKKLGRRKSRRQDFHHRLFECRELRPVVVEQGHELIDFRRADRASPDPFEKPIQHLAAISLLILPLGALEEDVGMRLGRPLFVERRADLNAVDLHLETVVSPGGIRDVANVQVLIAAGKRCGEVPERIPRDISQWDVEVNELGVVHRRRHRYVTLADHLREIRVVAGVGTEDQAQAGVLIGVH